jgi:hypothetical protein
MRFLFYLNQVLLMQKKIMILAFAFFLTITGFAQQQQEEEPVSPATVNRSIFKVFKSEYIRDT